MVNQEELELMKQINSEIIDTSTHEFDEELDIDYVFLSTILETINKALIKQKSHKFIYIDYKLEEDLSMGKNKFFSSINLNINNPIIKDTGWTINITSDLKTRESNIIYLEFGFGEAIEISYDILPNEMEAIIPHYDVEYHIDNSIKQLINFVEKQLKDIDDTAIVCS